MRVTTFGCDSPSCANFTEDLDAWWLVALKLPGESSGIFGFTTGAHRYACSPDCVRAVINDEVPSTKAAS